MRSAPKTIGTVYSLWVIYHPSMKVISHWVFDLQWLRTIFDKMTVCSFNLWIINEMQWCTTNTCTPPSIHVIKSSLNEIGLTVDELGTFEEITSKPRPLMNIDEIGTKNNRDRLLVMGLLPPKYESHQPLFSTYSGYKPLLMKWLYAPLTYE